MDYLNVWFSNKPIEKVRRPSMQHSSATDSYTKWESRQRSSIRRPSYEVAAGEFHSGYGKFKPPAQMGSPGGCSTISSIVEDNMGNDFLDFLIVLKDKHFKSTFLSKSYASRLEYLRDKLPGRLEILKKDDLTALSLSVEGQKKYHIEGNVMFKKIYMRLPKEDIYIDYKHYQNRYFNSKINELISIFSLMKAKSIKMSVMNENNSEVKLQLTGSLNAGAVIDEVKVGTTVSNSQKNNIQSQWTITFDEKKDKKIDIHDFANKKRFYYLPKEKQWQDIIRRRLHEGMRTYDYVYNYSDSNEFDVGLSSELKFLKLDFDYNRKNYENIQINYEVEYYPLTQVTTCLKCGLENHQAEHCTKRDERNEGSFLSMFLNGLF
jgi:hypothetical protein